MIVEFLPQANAELLDAVSYYEGELNGLGQSFWVEVYFAIQSFGFWPLPTVGAAQNIGSIELSDYSASRGTGTGTPARGISDDPEIGDAIDELDLIAVACQPDFW